MVVLSVALVGVLAACGKNSESPQNPRPENVGSSSSSTSADSYATAVCGAANDWFNEIKPSVLAMPSLMTSAKQAKITVVGVLDGAVTATETLITRVKDAGTPDIDGGREAAAGALMGLTSMKDAFVQAEETAKGLSTKDPDAFRKAVHALLLEMQSAM